MMNKADMKHKTMQFGLCVIKVEFKTVASLMTEGNEILAITVSSIKTARSNRKNI